MRWSRKWCTGIIWRYWIRSGFKGLNCPFVAVDAAQAAIVSGANAIYFFAYSRQCSPTQSAGRM